MADIFLSYANEDRERARTLAAAFGKQGWSVFWDRTIPAGRTWRQVIGTALEEAHCVVVLWSGYSINSDWVQEEGEVGRERNILIPVMIEDVRPPIGFRSIQAADLTGWDFTDTFPAYKWLIGDIEGILRPSPSDVEKQSNDAASEEAETNVPAGAREGPETARSRLGATKWIAAAVVSVLVASGFGFVAYQWSIENGRTADEQENKLKAEKENVARSKPEAEAGEARRNVDTVLLPPRQIYLLNPSQCQNSTEVRQDDNILLQAQISYIGRGGIGKKSLILDEKIAFDLGDACDYELLGFEFAEMLDREEPELAEVTTSFHAFVVNADSAVSHPTLFVPHSRELSRQKEGCGTHYDFLKRQDFFRKIQDREFMDFRIVARIYDQPPLEEMCRVRVEHIRMLEFQTKVCAVQLPCENR